MSFTYTKLFSSITSSTIWVQDPETKVVWVTMLAMADRYGRVFASIPGLAKDAVVPLAATERAIAIFLSPDPYSRTKDCDGRRIEEIDGGWRLINHAKYRATKDEEDQRQRDAERQRRHRAKKSVTQNVTEVVTVTPVSRNVTPSNPIADADADADADAKKTFGAKRAGDPRHKEFHSIADAYWQYANPGDEMPWGPGEAGQLGALLKANPKLTAEKFKQCLSNRHRSDGVNPSQRPMEWLSKITNYAASPLNQFHQPKGKPNGQADNTSAGRVNRNLQNLATAIGSSGDYAPRPVDGKDVRILPAPGDES